MKIIKLEILNLASLDRQEGEVINFEEGALGESTIFSIVGPTGSGKSTILDAICLALYNRTPRYQRKRGERGKIEIFGEPEGDEKNRLAPNDSRNILTRDKKFGYSKLTFVANSGVMYRAEWSVRKLQKKYDNAVTKLFKITREVGQLIEVEDNWEELPEIIGLEYEQFLRTVLIAQGSFATFISSKEEERYVLLEKLIGCGDLYSIIADKIKCKKDEAVSIYNQIVAQVSAYEKDLIAEDALQSINARILELDNIEKQVKEEINQLTKAIEWYITDEKHQKNIVNFEAALNLIKQKCEAGREKVERLALHDATTPAITIFNAIKTAENNVAKHDSTLRSLGEDIGKIEQFIKTEESNLSTLQDVAQETNNVLERQRPHINKAREIITKIQAIEKSLKEKQSVKTEVEKSKVKADEDLAENIKAIKEAEVAWERHKHDLQLLQKELTEEKTQIDSQVEKAQLAYNTENAKLIGCNAVRLQNEKSRAEKTMTDLMTAIRIQQELKIKHKQQADSIKKQNNLTERNRAIESELRMLEIEKLSTEVDTLNNTYTLMTSERWELHRTNLKDNEECPLCGSKHHPYCNEETFAPVIDNLSALLEEKRQTLKEQQNIQRHLSEEKAANLGCLSGIDTQLISLENEILSLNNQWEMIHDDYRDWDADVETLKILIPEIENDVRRTTEALNQYNNLVEQVDKLRKNKELAEQTKQQHDTEALTKVQIATDKINRANTLLATEKGKTDNLKAQQKDKTDALKLATDAVEKNTCELSEMKIALHIEIGDKEPDVFENELNNKKQEAEKSVISKKEEIARLRELLNKANGEEKATKAERDSEYQTLSKKKVELSDWLLDYNREKSKRLTETDIALLSSANDDWETIRAKQKQQAEAMTSAETTLNNEYNVYQEHQVTKPNEPKEELIARKTELENRSQEEMINLKACVQRHQEAKSKMGDLFEQRQDAAKHKLEWEQITEAIGSEGKTLRKIAQCYTLRFLIEHANAEIRKFNNRYELQQVKNSLGIRVIDHDRADDVRDTTSLSGGETFIVSLGLALGLSSLSSRNINFENLFIDEGFGTLDYDTLAIVIDSLAMLQTLQGKKVGVISHTDTMSERISTQIRIIKNGNTGSSHIEIYPKEL